MTYRVEYRLKHNSEVQSIDIKCASASKALMAADMILHSLYGVRAIMLRVWLLEVEEAWRMLDEIKRTQQVN